jgi:hypothetical protein
MDVIENNTARITICKHVFCSNCIETVIMKQQNCPMCRTALPSAEKCLVAPAQETREEEDPNSLENMGESSSKLDVLLRILDGAAASFQV